MISTFQEFDLNKQLLMAIEDLGYTEPTEIQAMAIPIIMQGHDVLGVAQTGTGKTAAYLLPILMKTKYAQGSHVRCLIVAPTRELVMQITEAAHQLAKYTDLRIVSLFGGLGPKTQKENLKAGVDIIVATPGRFMDLYLAGDIVTKSIQYLILDEADKMMDMGFMPQIRRILEIIPRKRKNLLFSATFQPRVENLSHEFLEAPIKVESSPSATAAETITQRLYEVPNYMTKIQLLAQIIDTKEELKTIVFCRTKTVADNVYKFLERKILGASQVRVIHANKGQNTRINAISEFKEAKIRVLVATDVAARGIDITGVQQVINFDVPLIYEDYIHRIGRTGRAKAEGQAITFMIPSEAYHIEKIEGIIRTSIPREPLPKTLTIVETPFEEQQLILKEIDNQRKKQDPDFLGAFHEKKAKNVYRPKPKSTSGSPKSAGPKTRSTGSKPTGKRTFKPKRK